MPKVIALPQTAPEENLHWEIKVDPEYQDEVWVCTVKGRWWLGIETTSFDRLPALKEKALKELKIAKATEGGGSHS